MGTYSAEAGAQTCAICPAGLSNLHLGSSDCPVSLQSYSPRAAVVGGSPQLAVVLLFRLQLKAQPLNVASLSSSSTGINGTASAILRLLLQVGLR